MEKQQQSQTSNNPEKGKYLILNEDWHPGDPDLTKIYSFCKVNNANDWLNDFFGGFAFEPDGQIVRYDINNIHYGQSAKVNVYRLREASGGAYITANINTDDYGIGLDYSSTKIEGSGSGLQRFIFLIVNGEYRILMPEYSNRIVHFTHTAYGIGPHSNRDYLIVSPFDTDKFLDGFYDLAGHLVLLQVGDLPEVHNNRNTE